MVKPITSFFSHVFGGGGAPAAPAAPTVAPVPPPPAAPTVAQLPPAPPAPPSLTPTTQTRISQATPTALGQAALAGQTQKRSLLG